MLKDGLWSRVFIHCSIIALRLVAPLCFIYCAARLLGWDASIYLPSALVLALDIYATSEVLFYFAVYLPLKWWLNRPAAPYVPLKTREERREAFDRAWGATPDPYGYISGWFKGVPVETLHREDMKDWLAWNLWNSTQIPEEDEAELDEYYREIEEVLQLKLEEGTSGLKPMSVVTEPLYTKHRPLLWYVLFVGGADSQMCATMFFYRYKFYSFPLTRFFSSLPLRWAPLLTRHRSPARKISYWYREHTAAGQLPVVFIHGIGVGLQFYLNFMHEFLELKGVGMIALEILPVCSRMTFPTLHRDEMTKEIKTILNHHGWNRCVLLTHSYGSVIAAQLLHNSSTADLIGPQIFADPVTFSFHPPQVAWNFLRRKPRTASEVQLEYFASRDLGVSHALTRSFIWSENSLFREELEQRTDDRPGKRNKCTIAIGGKDIITDTNTLGRYLTRRIHEGVEWYKEDDPMNDEWKDWKWTGEKSIEVIWSPSLNHAEIFDEKEDREKLFKVLRKYCKDGAVGVCPATRVESVDNHNN